MCENATPEILFVKTTEFAFEPMRGSTKAAGLDLSSAYEYTVPARGRCLLQTDLRVQLPSNTYGRVAARSGLALKHGIDVGAGVVDEDYRGLLSVLLFNHTDTDFKINRGDRIAQFISERIYLPKVKFVDSLDVTDRKGGFGSTGVTIKDLKHKATQNPNEEEKVKTIKLDE